MGYTGCHVDAYTLGLNCPSVVVSMESEAFIAYLVMRYTAIKVSTESYDATGIEVLALY